jgi:predicted DNA-binding transcriptional regulator AlpA
MINHLCRRQLAERLNVSQRTIERWWLEGDGPKGLRLGARRIVYPLVEVEAWEAQRLFTSRIAELAKSS